MSVIAKQPHIFKYGGSEEFAEWFPMFDNYCTVVGNSADKNYGLLLSFLDSVAFAKVQNLNLNEEQQKDIKAAEILRSITNALTKEGPVISPKIRLTRRRQKPSEDIADYASIIEKLASKAFPGENIQTSATVIEVFTTGLQDDNLSIHLLNQKFDTFQAAVEEAKRCMAAVETRRFIRQDEADKNLEPEHVFALESGNTNHQPRIKLSSDEDARIKPSSRHHESIAAAQLQSQQREQDTPQHVTQQPGSSAQYREQVSQYDRYQSDRPTSSSYGRDSYYPQYPDRDSYRRDSYRRNSNDYRPRRPRANVTCYFCGIDGHIKPECRYLKLMQQKFGSQTIDELEKNSKNEPRPRF